jgi:hypothetical protein
LPLLQAERGRARVRGVAYRQSDALGFVVTSAREDRSRRSARVTHRHRALAILSQARLLRGKWRLCPKNCGTPGRRCLLRSFARRECLPWSRGGASRRLGPPGARSA